MSISIKDWLKKNVDSFFWSYSEKLRSEQIVKIETKPFKDLECNFHETIVNESYRLDNNKWTHTEEVIKIIDVCVIEPMYANIIFKFNHIFQNSVFYSTLKPSAPKYIKTLFTSDYIELDESIILDGDVGTNYFHFFTDIMSKLWMLDKYGINKEIPLLISTKTYNTKYFQYLLKNTKISSYNWVEMKKYVRSKKTYHLLPNFYNFEYLNETKKFLLKNIKRKQFHENIFINRTVKSGRYIENFHEIEEVLKKYDFIIYDTSEMLLNEQVSLFYGAKNIISIHGAGNTNIIFTEPGVKFLEINPLNRISCHYYWLSNILNVDYNVILGGKLPYIKSYPEKSFYLDPIKLEKYITEWMLK